MKWMGSGLVTIERGHALLRGRYDNVRVVAMSDDHEGKMGNVGMRGLK